MQTATKQKLLGYLEGNGGNLSDALKTFQISRSEWEAELLSDPSLIAEVNRVKEASNDLVKTSIYKRALEGDAQAAKEFLAMNRALKITPNDPLGLDIL